MPRLSEQLLAHLYRGEITRSDTWRTRLDTTTNWALTSAAAVISFSFASPSAPHTIIIAGGFLVFTFLILEARRYRYYDLWARRVRLLEDGVVAPLLREDEPDTDAVRELADLLSRPRLSISGWDAIGLRLRRTYAPIFLVLFAAWTFKLYEHPDPAPSFAALTERARVGLVPGSVVLLLAGVYVVLMVFLYLHSMRRPLPSGELRPRRSTRRPVSAIFERRTTNH